jgi:hypothetical protein
MHVDLSFSYLRFAEAASFDKKELRRYCTMDFIIKKLEINLCYFLVDILAKNLA